MTNKAYKELENPIVRLWWDKNEVIYKVEIRHPEYMAYLNPETEKKND